MNPKLQKVIRDIDRTRAKIAELQELLPALESQKTDLENTEIVRQIRQAHIAPGELNAFVAAYRERLRNPKGGGESDTNINDERSDHANDKEHQTE